MMDADEATHDQRVDLSGDDSLKVSIADALNEQDVVKFTVHTRTTLPNFSKPDFEVTRLHEEFVWLYDRFVENDKYAGFILPPCPPKPDFSQSHGKLAKLQAGDPSMTQDELEKLKQEIQSEYLAAFQKTVAMHEVFLTRIAGHPIMREDENFHVFLEFEKDIGCRARSKKDMALDFFKSVGKTMDTSFSSHKDADQFFEEQKFFIVHYNVAIKDAKTRGEAKVKARHVLVSNIDKFASALLYLGNSQTYQPQFSEVIRKTADAHGKATLLEKKLVNKEDLKMTDLLRYYVADGQAAKDLLYRRVKAFEAQESAHKKLEQAKAKGKKVLEAQEQQTVAQERFERISKSAKEELVVFKQRRLAAFRKGLIQYATAQIKQAKESYTLWKDTLAALKGTSTQ